MAELKKKGYQIAIYGFQKILQKVHLDLYVCTALSEWWIEIWDVR